VGSLRCLRAVEPQAIEHAPAGEDPISSLAEQISKEGEVGGSPLSELSSPIQLALEMGVHESLERPALDGRLTELDFYVGRLGLEPQ
jgi:hypothetical protein